MRALFWSVALLLLLLLLTQSPTLWADQIEMQNGDRYSGVVMSMTPDTIVLKSEVLGQLKVPRAKVSTIMLGAANAANLPAARANAPGPAPAAAPLTDDTATALKQLGANTNLVEKIRKQFLADATPEANQKFDDMLTGLITGKLDMNSLRAQAKSAADQLRAMTKDSGGDSNESVQLYLQVLDSFLAESATPAATPATNAPSGAVIIR